MKLIVFGATGTAGKQLVKQALLNGASVKAFGRNVFVDDFPQADRLELLQGALFDEGQVLHALKDCEVVLSALGGAIDGTDKTRSLGIKNIVAQMKKAGVKRIIAVGGMGVLEDEEGHWLMDDEDFPKEYLAVSQEHKKALECLQQSGLEWTFVCPVMVIDGAATGLYKTAAGHLPVNHSAGVLAGDLALCMLNEITARQYLQQKVGISN
ncbi:MAG: hypothetical protein RL172_1158 [Bacteroidota bacterium]|jgi:uncharacterized protein